MNMISFTRDDFTIIGDIRKYSRDSIVKADFEPNGLLITTTGGFHFEPNEHGKLIEVPAVKEHTAFIYRSNTKRAEDESQQINEWLAGGSMKNGTKPTQCNGFDCIEKGTQSGTHEN